VGAAESVKVKGKPATFLSGATFYTTGMEHSPTSTTGTGCARTLWEALKAT
jgi:hypothetical protein